MPMPWQKLVRATYRRDRALAALGAVLLLGAGQGPAAAPTGCPPPRVTISFEPLPGPAAPAGQAAENPAPAAPVVPLPCSEYPLNLETALALAGAENPTIALAREAVRASQAEQLRAQALLLPTLDAGTNSDVHRGNLQSAQGVIEKVDRQAVYVGAGAAAVGAGTVTIPGVRLTAQVAEALFEPRAAREEVTARRFDALATRNRVLLDVTTTYFALLGAEARLQQLREAEGDLGVVVRDTANFASVGLRREGDADRALSEAALLHAREQAAEEEVAVASANLARLLHLDPSVGLRGPGGPLPLVQLVAPNACLEDLVQLALRSRPEVMARSADVAVLATHLREERVRPFVPLMSVGFSGGAFGGGSDLADTRFGHFSGRTDFDVLAVWSLDNLGLGNLAVQRQLRADVEEAEAERAQVIQQVRREVADAYALSAARWRELEIARRRVRTAAEGYRLDLLRARNLLGWPIEVLHSFRLLTAARQDLVASAVGFDQAQFRLFVALGQQPPTVPVAGNP
jgi:outer membrane protein TolC